MILLAILAKEISTSHIPAGGLAINQYPYLNQNVRKKMEPMTKKY